MRKLTWFALLLAGLLAACSTQGKTPALTLQPAAPGGVTLPEATDSPVPKLPTETTSATQVSKPSATPASTREPLPVSGAAMPGCTARSLFPTPNPTLEALFSPVSAEDWVRGPDTAAVKFIEYSDFQ